MHNQAPHSPGKPQAHAVPAALRQALRDDARGAASPGAPTPRDARADCIALASAVHQYLMTQRLLQA